MSPSRKFLQCTSHQAHVSKKIRIFRFTPFSAKHEPGVTSFQQISWGIPVSPREKGQGLSLYYLVRVLSKNISLFVLFVVLFCCCVCCVNLICQVLQKWRCVVSIV